MDKESPIMDYIGKAAIIETIILKQPDGWHECVYRYTQKRSVDGKDWEQKELALKSYGRTEEAAYSEVLLQINKYLSRVNFDLFEEDTKEENESVKDNETGKTQ
jgi:hypothetical protein